MPIDGDGVLRGLLVDDDKRLLKRMKRLLTEELRELGVSIDFAVSDDRLDARDQLRAAGRGAFALVLTDMYFPPEYDPDAPREQYLPHGLDIILAAKEAEAGLVVGYTSMQHPQLQDMRTQACRADHFFELAELMNTRHNSRLGVIVRSLTKGSGMTDATSPERAIDVRNVAVVHGANDRARDAMFEFLEAIDLNPVEFEEAAGWTGRASAPISDVLAELFKRTQAVVVLVTPDESVALVPPLAKDRGRDEAGVQARPNVYVEAGMALAANPDRTILVQLGETRAASDIGGLLALRLNDSNDARQKLADRLVRAGCPVRRRKRMWETKSFDEAIEL